MRKRIVIMLVLSIAITCFSKGVTAQEDISRVVYIDPAFDNDQLGPEIKQKDKAKKLLLNIASALKDNLNKQGDVTYVSGEKGVIKSIEDRSDEAKERHSSVFLSLSLTKANKDCINVHFPKFAKKNYQKGKEADKAVSDETFNMLGNSGRSLVSAESKTIATLMSRNINKLSVENCVKLIESNSYLLKITSFPTLIVEFRAT